MTQELKIILGIVAISVVVLVGAVFFLGKSSPSQTNQAPADPKILTRDDSWKTATDSAKVTLVEFSDFQCPACGAAYPDVKQVEANYQGKVNFVYRHFPLPQHKYGTVAALAAEAAGEQGKFWQMHDKLFENQDIWGVSDKPVDIFVGYAKDLGLNTDQFRQAVDSKKYTAKIQRDQTDGNVLGVNSTPTFFIDGIKYPGVLTYDEFKSKIDANLTK